MGLTKEIDQNAKELKKAEAEEKAANTMIAVREKALQAALLQVKLNPKDRKVLDAKAALEREVKQLKEKGRESMLEAAKLSGEQKGLQMKQRKVEALASGADLSALKKLTYFKKFIEARYLDENIAFLDKAPDRRCYELYVKAGSAQEVNLPSSIRNPLDEDYAQPGNRPPNASHWNDARKEIKKVIVTNVRQSFPKWVGDNIGSDEIKV